MYKKETINFKLLTLNSRLTDDILDKWDNTGFLTGLSNNDKLTVSNVYEMVYNILVNGDEQPANTVIFPIIRKLLTNNGETFHKLPEDFVFNTLNIKQLINLINNVFAVQEIIFKDIPRNLIDQEVALATFVSEMYINMQHSINNNHS
jgi:hypothetical protein